MGAGVMQNIYPLFERNQTLKKEMLWSPRDYTFAHARVKYQEYGQGILTGCSLSVQGEEIAVRPGLLKYGQAVYIMMEEARIPFGAAQEMRYLHMAVREDRSGREAGGRSGKFWWINIPGLATGLPVWYNKM